MDRDPIPSEIKRAVLVEAGHRCAIPTCRATTTEIAHIVPWAKTQDNSFDNLIALCPNCHARYDQKKEIDRQSMRMYKRALRPRMQEFAETILLGSQESELQISSTPVLTLHSWKHNCTVERLRLQTREGSGPVICATILDILIDGASVFANDCLRIDYGSSNSDDSSAPYNLVKRDWEFGSKVEFSFVQVGGGSAYQLLIAGVLR